MPLCHAALALKVAAAHVCSIWPESYIMCSDEAQDKGCSIHQHLGDSSHLLCENYWCWSSESFTFLYLIKEQQLQHSQARRGSQACISVLEAPQAALQPGKNTFRRGMGMND